MLVSLCLTEQQAWEEQISISLVFVSVILLVKILKLSVVPQFLYLSMSGPTQRF